jgi:hypothetical protein
LLDAFENFNTLNGTNSVRTSLQVENLISQQFSEKIKKLTGASYDLDSSINHFLNKEYAKLNSLKKNDLASLVSFSKDLLKKASIYLELPGFVQKYLEFSDKEIGSLVENFKYYLCFDKISEEGFRNALQKSIFELRDNSIRHDGQFYINPTPNVPDSIYQKILKNSYKSGNISIAGSGILMTAGLSSFLGFYGGLLLSILTLYITEVARYLVSDNVASYSSERYNVKNIGRGIFQSILFDRKYNKLFESCARDANLSVKLLAQKVNKKPLHQQTANFLDTILVETNEIRDYSGISFTKSFSDRKSPYSWIKKYSEALDEVRSNQ